MYNRKSIQFEEYLDKLMPLKNVLVQSLGFYLNYIQANSIGDYKLNQFDRTARQTIKKYQQKLREISQEIHLRNKKRTRDGESMLRYDLLNPQYTANSITS